MSAAAVAMVGAACVPSSRYREPRPVPSSTAVPNIDATAAALAGDWTGQYDAPFYARRGALRLSLRRIEYLAGGALTSTVAGTATISGPFAAAHITVDSARVGRGRVVLFLAPYADQESGATVQIRMDGALAADTLGGRLRVDGAATVAPEHRGGWRLIRAAPAATASRAP